jgi:hypothetical protein
VSGFDDPPQADEQDPYDPASERRDDPADGAVSEFRGPLSEKIPPSASALATASAVMNIGALPKVINVSGPERSTLRSRSMSTARKHRKNKNPTLINRITTFSSSP